MKQSRIMVLAAVALGVVLSAVQAQAEIGKAVVRTVRGKADFTQGSGWKSLRTGTVLRPGAIIRTAAESQVDLFLDQNGPVVRVTENTEMGLDKLNFEATGSDTVIETRLDLKSGRILGSVKPMVPSSRYEVATPQGVAGIKGTDYDISAHGPVHVIEGTVVFSRLRNGQPDSVVVNQGETFNPSEDRPRPTEPSVRDAVRILINEIKLTAVPIQITVPPREPYVSSVVGSGSGSTSGSSSTGQD